MNDQTPLDLSPLDPSDRWAGLGRATMERIDAMLAARPSDPLTLIASWTKPLTVTAGLVVLLLIPVEVALERREAETERVDRLVELSTDAVLARDAPTGAELMRLVGGGARP